MTVPAASISTVAEAEAFAATRPTGVTLEPKKIGLVNVLYSSDTARRIQEAFIEAATKLGWTVDAVDANGDPTKMQAAMANFVNQKVDAIINLSNATGAISQQLAAAKDANIPVILVGGAQDPDPNLKYSYVIDDVAQAQMGADYMVKHITPPGSQVAVYEAPVLLSIRLRSDTATAALKDNGFEVVPVPIDIANLVDDVNTKTNALLASNPNLSAIVVPMDVQVPMVAQILKQRGLCGKIQLYGYYDALQNLQAIADGCATSVVAVPANTAAYAAADQLAQYFSQGTEPAPDIATQEKAWGVQLQNGPSTIVIDKTNLPPAGEFVPTYYDVVGFFDKIWESEFGPLKG
jgi:ABC-type sugar transport system substrate-binding protein